MYCQETKSIMERRLYGKDLNHHHTYYGGQIASDIDTTCSIAAEKFCQTDTMTASIDRLDFQNPAYEGDMIRIEAFVTGSHHRSFEVFAKITATHQHHSFVVATAFMTFVILDKQAKAPHIEGETAFEKQLCESYEQRYEWNHIYRHHYKEFIS